MSIYVDSWNAPFRGMVMCHMMADTRDELLSMADIIGVQRKWIQKSGTVWEHFDVCLSKKKLAIASGAIEISAKEMVRTLVIERRKRK